MSVQRLQLANMAKKPRRLWFPGGLLVLLAASFFVFVLAAPAWAEFVPVDLDPPQIRIVSPQANAIVTETRPWIAVQVRDDLSGVAQEAITIRLDGVDVTKDADLVRIDQNELDKPTAWTLRYRPAAALWQGQHQVEIGATDGAGNVATQYWQFTVEGKAPEVGARLSLTNTLSYEPFPVGKLRDTLSGSLNVDLAAKHRFTVQTRLTALNYPGTSTKPICGRYYFDFGGYTVSWKNESFTLTHGKVSLPLEASLLRLGSVQQGTLLSRGNLNVFRGLSASSSGLGLLTADTLGVTYRWSSAKSKNYVYALQLGDSKTRVLGLRDERVFQNGLLQTELVYGMGVTKGGGLKLQGATTFLGASWDADLTYLQETYPLLHLSPLTSAEGGAYRLAINATKTLSLGPRLNLGLVQTTNNVDGTRDRTRQSQSIQLGMSGQFLPDFTWQASYQGARQKDAREVIQHAVRLGVQQKVSSGSWSSHVLVSGEGASDAIKFQWNTTYTTSFAAIGLKTVSSLQYSHESRGGDQSNGSWRVRLAGEKNWQEDRLKSVLALELQNSVQRQLATVTQERKSLTLEGGLDFELDEDHNLTVKGKATFWQHGTADQKRGADYSLNLALSSRIF